MYHLVLVSDTQCKLTKYPMPHKQCMTMKRKQSNPVNCMVKEVVLTCEEWDSLPQWIMEYVTSSHSAINN
jgi:hypothetical protein